MSKTIQTYRDSATAACGSTKKTPSLARTKAFRYANAYQPLDFVWLDACKGDRKIIS